MINQNRFNPKFIAIPALILFTILALSSLSAATIFAQNDAADTPEQVAETGTIVINTVSDPAAGDSDFSFANDIEEPNSFVLNPANSGSKTFLNVPVGTYTVSEDDPSEQKYVLSGLACEDSEETGATSTVSNNTATINLDSGETVTCTFTNTLVPDGVITIFKQSDPKDGTDFDFTLNGSETTPVFKFEWAIEGIDIPQFVIPNGIAVDNEGYIYAVAKDGEYIHKFDTSGQFILEFGNPGSGPGELTNAYNLAVDPFGNIIVADHGNNRIQKFDGYGNFIFQFGSSGIAPGQFNQVTAAAVDLDGNIYVADYGNHRIQKFDGQGNFLTEWGTLGSGPGEFDGPIAVIADFELGYIFVLDQNNNRVQAFDPNGNYVYEFGTAGTGPGEFNSPTDIAIDGNGFLFITDTFNDRIQKFDLSGSFVLEWGASGEFEDPTSIAVDGLGNIFITEFNTDRVQKFPPQAFTLDDADPDDGDDITNFESFVLRPGVYDVIEDETAGWSLDTIGCEAEGESTFEGIYNVLDIIDNPIGAHIGLQPGDAVQCLFINNRLDVDMIIEKSTDITVTVPGDLIQYSVIVENFSNGIAKNVVVTESVPEDTTFVPDASSPDWSCENEGAAGSTCTLLIDTMTSGALLGYTFAVKVDETVSADTAFVYNLVEVTNEIPELDPEDNTYSVTIPVLAFPTLDVNKDDFDKVAKPGGEIAYTLSYSNTGNRDAAGALLTETVPEYTTFVPSSSTAGWACENGGVAGSTCTLDLGTVPGNNGGGEAIFAVKVDEIVPLTLEQIENEVTFSATNALPISADDLTGVNINDIEIRAFDAQLEEGENGNKMVYEVCLSEQSGTTITVFFNTDTHKYTSAEADVDFVSKEGTLVFTPGMICQDVVVDINDDNIYEETEFFKIRLRYNEPADKTVIAKTYGKGTIYDNDEMPVVSIAPNNVIEEETHKEMKATVSLSHPSQLPVTVYVQSYDETAKAGLDYRSFDWYPVTFEPLETSKEITYKIYEDETDEADETFRIRLHNPENGTLGSNSQLDVTILDDDAPSVAYVEDVKINEGDGTVQVKVYLDRQAEVPYTVELQTADGSATAGEDYVATSQEIKFLPLNDKATVTIPVLNDAIDENDETVLLNLVSIEGAAITPDSAGELLILDNDGVPSINFAQDSVTINEGAGTVEFELVLSHTSVNDVTALVTFDGTGTPLADATPTAVIIPAGQLQKSVSLPLTNDQLFSGNSQVTVSLINAVNGQVGGAATTELTIFDDDGVPTLSIADVTVIENAGVAEIKISMSNPSAFETKVTLTTSDETAAAAKDYIGLVETITIPAGEMEVTAEVVILNDQVGEPIEQILLTLTDPQNGALDAENASAPIFIIDDDGDPIVEFSTASYEVDNETGSVVIDLQLTHSRATAASISIAIDNPLFGADAAYEVTFAAGETAAQLMLDIPLEAVGTSDLNVPLTLVDPVNLYTGTRSNATLLIPGQVDGPTINGGFIFLPFIALD